MNATRDDKNKPTPELIVHEPHLTRPLEAGELVEFRSYWPDVKTVVTTWRNWIWLGKLFWWFAVASAGTVTFVAAAHNPLAQVLRMLADMMATK